MRGDVELRPVPQRVGSGAGAVVELNARVDPGAGGQVKPMNVVGQGVGVPQAPPPDAVVPPQLALRLGPGGGAAGAIE